MAAQPTALRAAPPIAAAVPPPAAQPEAVAVARRELVLLRWALGVPLAAMASVLALYLLGALWKWGEMADAGLVPTDVLSFVPSGQILGRGVQLVVLAVLALPLPLALAWLLHRALPASDRPWGIPSVLAKLTADHKRLRRDVDGLIGKADPVVDAGFDRRVRRLRTRARHQRAEQLRAIWATRAAVAVAVAAALLVISPVRVAVALFGAWLIRRTRLSTLRVVAALFALVLLAVSAERYTAP